MSRAPSRDAARALDRVSAYDYHLPPGQIARYPAERRDGSRLLCVTRIPAGRDIGGAAGLDDLAFTDLPGLIQPGDLVVVNDSRVIPARLLGRKPTGAECEVLLVRPMDDDDPERWEALVRPGPRLKPGTRVIVGPDFEVVVDTISHGGMRVVRLVSDLGAREAVDRYGHMPLPPYIDRPDEALDRDRYQTVYADVAGSVAAPTAGLHFSEAVLDALRSKGTRVAAVTLHVGPGTFRPVESESLADHTMHSERWIVPAAAARAIEETRAVGGRIWAVGTTVVRTLESAGDPSGRVRPGTGSTDLFISPGYRFRVVDGLVTNFHLPRSTLLMLVAAFAGYETTMDAYRHAVEAGYRFYSYGDAMVIPPTGTGRPPGDRGDPSVGSGGRLG